MISKSSTLLLILMILSCQAAFSQQDSIKRSPVEVHGNIQLTNDGISFVPAFSLGKPAILTMLFINKNWFYFIPEWDFGTDLKPWQIGNRLGVYIIRRPKLSVGLGSGLGLYFNRRDTLLGNEEFQLQRYTIGELNATYSFSETRRVQAYYFYSHRLDKVGIESGHMIMVNAVFDRLMITRRCFLTVIPTFVWLTNTAPGDGVFLSQVTYLHIVGWRVNISLQTTLPVYTKPRSDFIWNTGLNFTF